MRRGIVVHKCKCQGSDYAECSKDMVSCGGDDAERGEKMVNRGASDTERGEKDAERGMIKCAFVAPYTNAP